MLKWLDKKLEENYSLWGSLIFLFEAIIFVAIIIGLAYYSVNKK